MARKAAKPRDMNALAAAVVTEATTEPQPEPLAVVAGRKGGQARAEKLPPKRRREIAREANRARWAKEA